MILPKPLRVVFIIIAAVALFAPAMVYRYALPQGSLPVMGVIQLLFPLWSFLLVQSCMDEGRERERDRREGR